MLTHPLFLHKLHERRPHGRREPALCFWPRAWPGPSSGPLADKFGHKRIILFSWEQLSAFIRFSSAPNLGVCLAHPGRLILIFSFSISMVMASLSCPERGLGFRPHPGLSWNGRAGGRGAGAICRSLGVPTTLWIISFLPLGASCWPP